MGKPQTSISNEKKPKLGFQKIPRKIEFLDTKITGKTSSTRLSSTQHGNLNQIVSPNIFWIWPHIRLSWSDTKLVLSCCNLANSIPKKLSNMISMRPMRCIYSLQVSRICQCNFYTSGWSKILRHSKKPSLSLSIRWLSLEYFINIELLVVYFFAPMQ